MSKICHVQASEEFRSLLKELRTKKGLTQAAIADKLGMPQSYVSKIETGERRLDFVETFGLCEAIGVPFSTFVSLYSVRIIKSRKVHSKAQA